jgi:hypothetical protein
MDITCIKSPFIESVDNLLRELNRVDFFTQGLLIGSWPMAIYTDHFELAYGLMTNDIDFAVENALKIKKGKSLPELLERLGYTSIQDYSGIETFVQGTFEVEFITHRPGGNGPPAVTVSAWQVAAQPLPFIDLLFIRPVSVFVEDFSFRIPSPEALMLHKLIVAQRRTGRDKEAKKEKDLQQCSALAEIIRVEEVKQIIQTYRMSKKVRGEIVDSCTEADLAMPRLGISWPQS